MNKRYLDILNKLKNVPSEDRIVDSKILLIDGLWLNAFIRAFAVNPTITDDGIHVGGIVGFLHTIGYAIKVTRPTRVIIAFDGPGGSVRRKQIYPEYKANRRTPTRISRMDHFSSYEEENHAKNYQIRKLVEYLQYLPVQYILAHDIEADDVIAYLANEVYDTSECIIMSTDQDYLQLVNDRITVWSPTKKKMYNVDTLTKEFGITPNNFLMYKMLVGDTSDGIPGIKGIGLKSIIKRLPILCETEEVTIDKLLKYSDKQLSLLDEKGKQVHNYKIYKDVLASKDQLVLNDDLIQLRNVNITRNTKILLSNQIKQPINRLLKHQFLRLVLEDKMNVGLKNPNLWMKEIFTQLDVYASETYD